MAATNNDIIFQVAMDLMEAGTIRGTGRMMKATTVNDEGELVETMVEEPEALHTFARWKAMGYMVRKGEKAIAKVDLWKPVTKKKGEDEEEEKQEGMSLVPPRMFKKTSHLFAAHQVERLQLA